MRLLVALIYLVTSAQMFGADVESYKGEALGSGASWPRSIPIYQGKTLPRKVDLSPLFPPAIDQGKSQPILKFTMDTILGRILAMPK